MRPTGAATTTPAYALLENCMLDPPPRRMSDAGPSQGANRSLSEGRRAAPRVHQLQSRRLYERRLSFGAALDRRASDARPDVFRQSSPSMQPPPSRIAPCPCGSGKRYKECHGAVLAPGLSVPKADDLAAKAQRALTAGRPAEALAHLRQA